MDFVGVAHQENLIVFPDLFQGGDAFAWNVQQHGVPNRVEFLVGHFLLAEDGFGFLAEGGCGVDASVEFAHDVHKLLGMSQFRSADTHFFEFFVDNVFVDVEDHAAEVEDDVLDFCAHF